MAHTRKINKLTADYTEELILGALSMAFVTWSKQGGASFAITPFSKPEERESGADALLDVANAVGADAFQAIYMQFKRPYGIEPDGKGTDIMKARKKLKSATGQRVLYFKLQDFKPTLPKKNSRLQHNLLFDIANGLHPTCKGNACYVCPLSINREVYLSRLWWAQSIKPSSEITTKKALVVKEKGQGFTKFLNIECALDLDAHLAVQPHSDVDDAKHSYSFLSNGSDCCFHSKPVQISNEKAMPLGQSIAKVVHGGDGQSDAKWGIPLASSRRTLSELVGVVNERLRKETVATFGEEVSTPKSRAERMSSRRESVAPEHDSDLATEGLSAWLEWGSWLRENYDIHQFMVLKWPNRNQS